MKRRHAVAVLLLVSSTTPRWVAAQDKDPMTETARRRFQEGVRFYDEKRYEDARAAFMQAYALRHHPAVLLNLAQSELRGNHPLEAARHFASYLRESPSASASERAEAEKGLAAARSRIGRLQISVSTIGADVFVDNDLVGSSPLPEPVDVSPGAHAIEARLTGRSASAGVTATAGKTTPVSLSIETSSLPAAASAAAQDPEPSGSLPDEATTIPPGVESNAAADNGHEGFFSWLGHSGVGLTGLGVTAIGLGLFAGFGIAGIKAADNADNVAAKIAEHGMETGSARVDLCNDPIEESYQLPCETLRDNIDKRDTDRAIATVGLVAAGVGLTTTISAYFLTRKSNESPATAWVTRKSSEGSASSAPAMRKANEGPATSVTPLLGPHVTGLAIVGAF